MHSTPSPSRTLSARSVHFPWRGQPSAGSPVNNARQDQPAKPDLFPATAYTWIDGQMGAGQLGRDALNRHIMLVYAEPLKAYYLGTSYRTLGEADDVVNGFFASRLGRVDFVATWRGSNLRLRRWLMNALCFYLRELCHARSKTAAAGGEGTFDPADEASPDAERALEREFARASVQAAMNAAAQDLAARGLAEHFDLLRRYAVEGESCESLAAGSGRTGQRVWVMIRTAQRAFVKALSEVLSRDGVSPEDLAGEVGRLMAAMHR